MTTNENHRGRLFAAVAVPGGRTSALLVYTLSHAAVDLACGYILYSMYRAGAMPVGRTVLLFLLYNTLAFGLQIVFGAVCDRFGGCRLTAVLGCLSTVIGVTVGSSAPVLAVLLVGVGNAAFHTGGGCDTLLHTDGMTEAAYSSPPVRSGLPLERVSAHWGRSRLMPSPLCCFLRRCR